MLTRIPIPVPVVALLLFLGLAPPAAAAKGTLVGIRVHPDRASIFPGGAFAFGAIGIYDDGSTRDVTRRAKFSSSNPAVAFFVKKNIVLAGAVQGSTGISASLGEIVSPAVSFGVSEIASLSLEPGENGIRLGSLVRWAAAATLKDGSDGLGATNLLDWSSSDPDVVPIGNEKRGKALSRGDSLGSATITAEHDRSGASVSRQITVVQMLESVAVAPALRVVQIGDGGRFRALGSFEGGVVADVSLDVGWSSSDRAVASIDKIGRAKLKGFGTTVVSVVDEGTGVGSEASGGNAQLVVVGDVLSLTLTPPLLDLPLGGEAELEAEASVEGSDSSFPWSGRVQWLSSVPAVASVDAGGVVRCESAGSASISARDPRSGVSGDAQVECD
jgi:hypothetical protein